MTAYSYYAFAVRDSIPHSAVHKYSNSLEYYVLSTGKHLPTFQKRVVFPSSGPSSPRRFGLCDCVTEEFEVLLSSETSLTVYQSTRRKVAEELNLEISPRRSGLCD